ncbi:Serine/threonine-protein kinase Sgk2, partial [Linderina macrospora]
EVDWYCLGAVLFEMLTGLPPFYDQDSNVMYRRILQEPLRFPSALPPPLPGNGTPFPGANILAANQIGRLAQDFVFRLMERDPKKRLGAGVFGTENVKRHAFFYGIDWGKIYRQEYAPPFVPKVSSIFDLSNIDPEFRNEPIPASVIAEGQVDILAEVAEADRRAELEMQSKLAAFPSPMLGGTQNSLFGDYGGMARTSLSNDTTASTLRGTTGSDADIDATVDAFQGFSFVSPWVDASQDSD